MSGAGPTASSAPAARKSFAQVAAAAHKSPVPRAKPTASADANKPSQQTVVDSAVNGAAVEQEEDESQAMPAIVKSSEAPAEDASRLNSMMKGVTLDEHQASGLDHIGRKENSDTKSVASRTTFTLDEKESLRPDDSASMQAGGDDDSPSESVIATAKMNSSSDARAFQDQLYEIDRTETSRMLAQRQVAAPPQRNGGLIYATPSGAPQQQADASQQPPSSGPPPGLIIPPDEKLQEALASPKDRLFVLKVEQDLIDFVKDSNDHELQLPQTNAFYRMLCHKLAEYYFLGHVVDDSMSAVRIFRLPHSRLPPPLINSESKPEGSTPPPTSSTRKIMRRGAGAPHLLSRDSEGEGSHGRPDTNGSGSGSDEDRDGHNKPKDKSSLTREEREKQYAEVRARIFEDFSESKPESEGGTGQDSKGISRTSSASGHRKKTKKRPKDDSFEARSAYSQFNGQSYVNQGTFRAQSNTPYYPVMAGYPGYPGSPQQYSPQPGYQMGSNQMMSQDYASASPWMGQQYGIPYDMNQSMGAMPQHSPAPYDGSSGPFQPYPASSMHNMQSQSTPKPHQPSLAGGYYQGYQQSPNGTPWAQQTMPQGYGPPNSYPGGGDGTQFMASYSPQAGYPSEFQQQPQQQGFPGQAFNMYQPNFNPQSQAFIPRSHSGQWTHLGPQMQPQHLNSAFNSPRYSNASPNISATRSNQSHSQNSKKSSQTSGNMESITKWATPANLPAKPPPTNTIFNMHAQKGHQSLPSHPLAAPNSGAYKE